VIPPRPDRAGEPAAAETLAELRRSATLGPVLPEGAEDESVGAWGEDDYHGAMSDDEWLRDVPPHHG
jgi:hypothetical protein